VKAWKFSVPGELDYDSVDSRFAPNEFTGVGSILGSLCFRAPRMFSITGITRNPAILTVVLIFSVLLSHGLKGD
jgi:hypothetical protein